MEQNGIRCRSADAFETVWRSTAGKIAELEKKFYEVAGEILILIHQSSLEFILFENIKPGGVKTKTGYSTAADVLEKLAPDHPIEVVKILEYRQYTKLKVHMQTAGRIIFRMMGGSMENLTRRLQRPENQQYGTESSEYSGKDGTGTSDPESIYSGGRISICGC